MSNNDPDRSMRPPPLPMDPTLGGYTQYPYSYSQQQQASTQMLQGQQQQQQQYQQQNPQYGSPDSQDSDVGTPPMASGSSAKRPAGNAAGPSGSRKKARKDDEDVSVEGDDGQKVKPTRGSRACTVCRRLKMKCVGAEQGPPCKRCQSGNHQCVFEESNRGKRSSKKHEILTRSLEKMERTLDTVLRSIGNPIIATTLSRSPSPSTVAANTQALLDSEEPPPDTATSVAGTSTFPRSQTHSTNGSPSVSSLNRGLPSTRGYTTPGSLLPLAAQQSPGSPKLHSLPDNCLNPLGLLAEASLANRRAHAGRNSIGGEDGVKPVGVASDNYFKPGPMTILPLRRLYIERQIQPEMLSFVTTEDVVALFNIYFDHINRHCNLLDREFHTPSLVCSRSPFLLTVICAIASKYYTARPELYPRLLELSTKLCFTVPAQGYKSLEIVQAYLLVTMFGCGAVERYEQEKTWMMLGLGLRMATDLNLHKKTTLLNNASLGAAESKARDLEVHNRERTWLVCYCLDRSLSAQMGKPHTIQEDFILRNVRTFYKSPVALPPDSAIAAYVEYQQIMSRALDLLYAGTNTTSGLQTHCDYLLVIKTLESQLFAWQQHWVSADTIALFSDVSDLTYRRYMADFYWNYGLLVLNSFGLQNAMENTSVDIGHFFARCHTTATACATTVRDQLGHHEWLKYSPDSHFVQISYAVLSLLKLVRPEFQAYLDDEAKPIKLVSDVADVLESLAGGPQHTSALYSTFLRALISARVNPPAAENTEADAVPLNGTPSIEASPFPSHSLFQNYNGDGNSFGDYQVNSEMGPVADMSTFPPTMAAAATATSNGALGMFSMDNILSSNFWDSMLVPGYSNSFEGLSGGFVFGAGGTGIITPHFGHSPVQSGQATPGRANFDDLTQQNINAAFQQAV